MSGRRPLAVECGEDLEPDRGTWLAREIMYAGGENPTPVDCGACASDPRPRNCGGWAEPPPCCAAGAAHPCDGAVIATPDRERGKDYNHSLFAELVIAGLVGLRAVLGGAALRLRPLFAPLSPSGTGGSFFALDNVYYHGFNISVAFENSSGSGAGRFATRGCAPGNLCVWVDGALAATMLGLGPLNVTLPVALPVTLSVPTFG